jgi:hypothetical protein
MFTSAKVRRSRRSRGEVSALKHLRRSPWVQFILSERIQDSSTSEYTQEFGN